MRAYRVFEQVRTALLVSFVSGFINAYTYNTQGGRFAGVQTGNLFMMALSLAQKQPLLLVNYAIPVFSFAIGQLVTYGLRRWVLGHGWRWHAFSAKVLVVLLLLTALISPYVGEHIAISLLALFASIQLETFKRMRHLAYANIMMTGNLKNASIALVRGIFEKNLAMTKQAYGLFAVILSFMAGVVVSTVVSPFLYEQSLYLLLLPLLLLNIWLEREKSA